jgi:hypothetical protein
MRMLLLGLGLFIAACGGKVVVDLPGGGGGGAGGTGAGAGTPTTGSVIPTGPVTGPGPTTGTGPTDLCSQLCAFWENANCPMNKCGAQCAAEFQTAGPCIDKLTSAIQCIITHPGEASMCQMPSSCIGIINSYQSCVEPNDCDNGTCAIGPDGSCACKGVCDGISLDVECAGGACKCHQNGSFVGSCNEPAPACDFFNGCCAQFFFPGE